MGFSFQINLIKTTLVFFVILLVLISYPYNKVNAWSGNIPTCGEFDTPVNMPDEIRHIYQYYKDSSRSYVIWRLPDGRYFFTSSIDSKRLTFYGSGTQRVELDQNGNSIYTLSAQLVLPDPNGATDKIKNGYITNMGYYENTNPSNSQNYANYQITTASCIYAVNNVVYNNTYTGNTYIGTGIDLTIDPKEVCQQFDISCYISTSFEYIGDTFKEVTQAMLNVISDLFIPNMTNIDDSINNLSTNFYNQIGFLVFPFEFISNVFDAFDDSGYYAIQIPPLFGSDYWTINRPTQNPLLSDLLPYIRPFLQLSIFIVLIGAYHNKFKEITA